MDVSVAVMGSVAAFMPACVVATVDPDGVAAAFDVEGEEELVEISGLIFCRRWRILHGKPITIAV